MAFDLGDVIPLSVAVTDSSGNAANATAVTLTITLPDGTTATPSTTNPTTGTYRCDYSATMAGRYEARWVFTGSNAGAVTDTFTVNAASPTGIVSLADAKDHLNITSTTGDEELRRFIGVASAACENYTGRTWRRTTYTETLDGGSAAVVLAHPPVLSVTTVTENGATVAASGYSVSTTGVVARVSGYGLTSWYPGYRNVSVTYVAGAAVVPDSITHGVLEMVRHLWSSQRGASLPLSVSASDEWSPADSFSIPRRVQELWEPHRLSGVA